MPAKKSDDTANVITIQEIETQRIDVAVVGLSPLILHRMSQKGLKELLFPSGRASTAERQSRLKHDPLLEFQGSPYRFRHADSATLIGIMPTAFKGAMKTAALDVPGATKAQIGRLLYVEGDLVPVWGIPELLMSVTRSSDINRTPDVRTRAIVRQWAALVAIRYVVPILRETTVVNLLQRGGSTAGIGDWRPEKGNGSYGRFRVTNPRDDEFQAVCRWGGRAAQAQAMEDATPYDMESDELLSWFRHELLVRGRPGERVNGAVDDDEQGEVLEGLPLEG